MRTGLKASRMGAYLAINSVRNLREPQFFETASYVIVLLIQWHDLLDLYSDLQTLIPH